MGSPALLQEDLESELHRATPLEQADGLMQVDVMARCEHERALGVVPRTLEPFMTPLLDPVVLGDVQNLEFSRRHFVALPFRSGGLVSLAYSSSETYRTSPFWGDLVQGP